MPRDTREEGFSRRHRFGERGSFGPVLGSARKIRGRYAVVHVAPGKGEASRLGIALTRRLVPSALHRNRFKRLLREAFRRHAVKHAGLDCVVTLRARLDPATHDAVVGEIRGAFDQLSRSGPQ